MNSGSTSRIVSSSILEQKSPYRLAPVLRKTPRRGVECLAVLARGQIEDAAEVAGLVLEIGADVLVRREAEHIDVRPSGRQALFCGPEQSRMLVATLARSSRGATYLVWDGGEKCALVSGRPTRQNHQPQRHVNRMNEGAAAR
jgi:hypothetical protein